MSLRPCTLLAATTVTILLGCKGKQDNTDQAAAPTAAKPGGVQPGEAAAPEAAGAPAVPQNISIELKKLDSSSVPAAAQVEGTVENVIGWSDKNGDNLVVFSSKTAGAGKTPEGDPATSKYLFVTHLAHPGGQMKVLRTVQDKEEKCEFDLDASFQDKALSVTDLDADQLGEVTFAYRLNCASDLSPSALKLLILENGDKYIVRGSTRIKEGGQVIGGEKTPDDALKSAPAQFRSHADAMWEQIADH